MNGMLILVLTVGAGSTAFFLWVLVSVLMELRRTTLHRHPLNPRQAMTEVHLEEGPLIPVHAHLDRLVVYGKWTALILCMTASITLQGHLSATDPTSQVPGRERALQSWVVKLEAEVEATNGLVWWLGQKEGAR